MRRVECQRCGSGERARGRTCARCGKPGALARLFAAVWFAAAAVEVSVLYVMLHTNEGPAEAWDENFLPFTLAALCTALFGCRYGADILDHVVIVNAREAAACGAKITLLSLLTFNLLMCLWLIGGGLVRDKLALALYWLPVLFLGIFLYAGYLTLLVGLVAGGLLYALHNPRSRR
ncbi:MAG TPA: hypothetical protein VGV38_17735 [Pyrinomonadaceae bacterium]|nr:hypothetical protein [Pyrinomonadaceae bacterium]